MDRWAEDDDDDYAEMFKTNITQHMDRWPGRGEILGEYVVKL